MKVRPTIFLSGVSGEFGSFRDAVENEIEMKGCFAENQPGFPPDYRTVEEMLRRKLHDSDAVIHIVGFRFGAEPNQRPDGTLRRSYTQMEFDIARAMNKPVYVFISAIASVRDAPRAGEAAEAEDVAALQLAHRSAVQSTNHLYYFFKDCAGLCTLAAEIPLVAAARFRAHISDIVGSAPANLLGREAELKLIDEAWRKVRGAETQRPHILTVVAVGGEGKTSLVAKWAAGLAHQGWPDCDAVFAWSFYSQGTRDQTAVSSDAFIAAALTFFGDNAMAKNAAGAFDKGRRLAELVGERRALLILDGVEPLQYAPASPSPGELKDQGVAALLKGLATISRGLCIVTTRYKLPDLRAWWQTTAPMIELPRLPNAAGVQLLRSLGVSAGTPAEFETLVEDVDGHALTLLILGGFLARAHHGDIRRRDRVDIQKADARIQGGHAFRAMAAYVTWLEHDSDESRRELAILSLLGLFDRPAMADCVAALRRAPAICGLTEPLVDLSEEDWEWSLSALCDAKLLTVNRTGGSGEPLALDAHPLLRDFFARRVRDGQPEAWRAAHRRLYEHLCKHQEGDAPTLEDLQPLYQAVAHGCRAGLQRNALEVFYERIAREAERYSSMKLGASGTDLGTVANFFEPPWSRVSPALKEADRAWLLNEAGMCLRASGRLTEALEPMRAGLEMQVKAETWKQAAGVASNLSELELLLGEVAAAERDARQSVTYANRSGDMFHRLAKLCTHADALHQAGRRAEAEASFSEADRMQAELEPDNPLYSLRGFKSCDLLLASAERAAWRVMAEPTMRGQQSARLDECRSVEKRAAQTIKWLESAEMGILSIALDHLTLGRAALYAAILDSGCSDFNVPRSESNIAVTGLRRASAQEFIVRGLLTRGWCSAAEAMAHKRHDNEPEGARLFSRAQEDLDEAWDIAERGPMPLFLADIHLYRARLFLREARYPWTSAQHDLAESERLIDKHGYHRRDDELADAKAAIIGATP